VLSWWSGAVKSRTILAHDETHDRYIVVPFFGSTSALGDLCAHLGFLAVDEDETISVADNRPTTSSAGWRARSRPHRARVRRGGHARRPRPRDLDRRVTFDRIRDGPTRVQRGSGAPIAVP
jgi:hypothetical protein